MDKISWFADSGYLFREQVTMSGVVPQVAAMVGPGAAGTAYIPALADFVPMVKGTSSMALGGPALVKAVTGKDISEEDLGGAKVHNDVSGVADRLVKSDEECLQAVKTYLSFMPSHCGEAPPVAPCDDPVERREEGLLDILPESSLNRSAVSITDICVEICLNFRFVVSLKVHCTMIRSDMPLRDIRPETSLNRYVAVFMADIWVEAF